MSEFKAQYKAEMQQEMKKLIKEQLKDRAQINKIPASVAGGKPSRMLSPKPMSKTLDVAARNS